MNSNLKHRNILALSLAVGSLLAAGSVMANPPKGHDKHTDTAATTESQKPVTDSWITTKVKADLLTSENVPGTDIKVETKNGVVWLSGIVKTQAERDKAVSVTQGIEGVKKVEADNLKVSSSAKN